MTRRESYALLFIKLLRLLLAFPPIFPRRLGTGEKRYFSVFGGNLCASSIHAAAPHASMYIIPIGNEVGPSSLASLLSPPPTSWLPLDLFQGSISIRRGNTEFPSFVYTEQYVIQRGASRVPFPAHRNSFVSVAGVCF